eukprot:3575533-Rhodomonas_salina.2
MLGQYRTPHRERGGRQRGPPAAEMCRSSSSPANHARRHVTRGAVHVMPNQSRLRCKLYGREGGKALIWPRT